MIPRSFLFFSLFDPRDSYKKNSYKTKNHCRNFLSRYSFKLLRRQGSERLNSKASLSKTSKASNNHKQTFCGVIKDNLSQKIGMPNGTHRCWRPISVMLLAFALWLYSNMTPLWTFSQGCFDFFRNSYFTKHLRTTAWKKFLICLVSLYRFTNFVAVSFEGSFFV